MTPRTRRTTKTKPKASTKKCRLPAPLRITGEVLMARPPQSGAVAHRRFIITDTENTAARNPIVGTLTAACQPPADDQPPAAYAQFSAGWADHTYHAVACPGCFPEATP